MIRGGISRNAGSTGSSIITGISGEINSLSMRSAESTEIVSVKS